MQTYQSIQDEVKERTAKAKRNHTKPASVRNYNHPDVVAFAKTIPFLGEYIPEGWEDSGFDTPFVDATGLDTHGPALSLEAFGRKLYDLQRATPDHFGVGIIHSGDFQVTIRIYKVDSFDFTRSGNLTEAELSQLGKR